MSRTKQQKNPDRNRKEGGVPGKDNAVGANDGGARSRDERVHNRLAVLRAARGVTRRKLAEELGIHYQTMGYLERGEYAPSLHLALRIARWFGVPVESVFSLDEFPPLI